MSTERALPPDARSVGAVEPSFEAFLAQALLRGSAASCRPHRGL